MDYILIELFLTSYNGIYSKFRINKFLFLENHKIIL